MIRLALPALLIAGAVAAGLAVASERHGAAPVRHAPMASVLSTGELAAMARTEIAAVSSWVSPPVATALPVAVASVAPAPRWVPLPPRRAVGL